MKPNPTPSIQRIIWIRLMPIAFALVVFCQCLLNPAIQSVANPVEDATSPLGFLALFAGGGTTNSAAFQVSGQLKDTNGNFISGATLSVSSGSISAKNIPVSTSTSTNATGRFLLNLSTGTTKITVTSSAGSTLGNFNLVVSEDSVSQTTDSNSQFNVSGVEKHELSATVTFPDDSAPSLISSVPANGDISVPFSGSDVIFTLIFSKDMKPDTISGSTITISGGSVSVTAISSKIYVVTIASLFSKQSYVLTLSSGIKDLNGNSLPTTAINFMTAMAP